MSQHQEEKVFVKNFSLTAIFSFAIILCLFLLLSNCHGDFHPGGSEHHSTAEQTHTPSH